MDFFVLPVVCLIVLGFVVYPVQAVTENPASPSNIQEWIQDNLNYWFKVPEPAQVNLYPVYLDAVNKRVGIDNSSPIFPLQVRRAGGAGSLGIGIDNYFGGPGARDVKFAVLPDNAYYGGGMLFTVHNAEKRDINALVITEEGNIGVNTTTPGYSDAFVGHFLTLKGTTNFASNFESAKPTNLDGDLIGSLVFSNTENGGGAAGVRKSIAVIAAYLDTADSNLHDDSGGDLAFFVKGADGGSIFERMRIKSNGMVQVTGFGAGTVMSDATGNLYIISDPKFKTNIRDFKTGLQAIEKLNPITYKFNAVSGLDTVYDYTGFSAENVKDAIPEAVFSKPDTTWETVISTNKISGLNETKDIEVPKLDKDGKQTTTLSISDRAIIATLVNAVKEQQKEIDMLKGVCGK